MKQIQRAIWFGLGLSLSMLFQRAWADGLAIDNIYHPYVQAGERELEWRMISENGRQKHRLGLGKAVTDNLLIEGYITGDKTNIQHHNDRDIRLISYELETKWQITEQGEYSIDWGGIAELQRDTQANSWEFSTAMLMEKEWGRWVGAANIWAFYEWGPTIHNELDTRLALQLRYRYARQFEPAVEFYAGEFTRGLGPVVTGTVKFQGRKKLHWEAGAILGLDAQTPANTWRFLAEFEF